MDRNNSNKGLNTPVTTPTALVPTVEVLPPTLEPVASGTQNQLQAAFMASMAIAHEEAERIMAEGRVPKITMRVPFMLVPSELIVEIE